MTTTVVDNTNTELKDWDYQYNERHQLTDIVDRLDTNQNIAYTFDPNGNQTSKTQAGVTTDFLFDARDHIRQVLVGGSSVGQFLYDPHGLRIEKIGDRGVERYTYDDLSVLLQYNGDNNTVAKFDWGPDRLLSLNHITEGTQFYLTDVLGSVVNLTHNDGSIQARYQYDAWGNRRNQVGDSWNRFAFTGHEEDTETGLLYAKARFYDPDTGRFLSQDAWEGDLNTPPSLHKYLYAYQNPTVYVDPDGNTAILEGSAQGLRDFADQTRQAGAALENNGINVFEAFSYSLGIGLLEGLAAGVEVANQAGNLAIDAIASDNSTSYFVRDARRDLAETRFELADAIESGARSYRAARENPEAAISEVTSNVTRIVEDFASGDTGTITEFGAALIPTGAGVVKAAQVAGKAGKKSVDAVQEAVKSRKAQKQAQSNTSQISSNGSNVADGEFGIEGVDGGRVPDGEIITPSQSMLDDPYHPDWKNFSGARAVGADVTKAADTRVGRWMSPSELAKMRKTGKVQESYSGTTHVANPADAEAFIKQTKVGNIYVEFDVPTSSLKQTNEGWAQIAGPNSLSGRLAAKKGLPIPQMPAAANIVHKATKIR